MAPALPCIDLARLRGAPEQRAREVAALRAACADVGFFYAVNHGVPEECCAAALSAARLFFALPEEEKLRIDTLNSPHTRGYARLGGEQTAGKVDLREQIDLGPEAPAVDWRRQGLPSYYVLQGPNQWPRRPSDFRGAVERLWTELRVVARDLMRGIAAALGQPPALWEGGQRDYFSDAHTAFRMKVIHYPACAPHEEGYGVGAHKDYGFLAVLLQDSVGGLQVLGRDGRWIDATPVPGAFVCNIGELLELSSRGAFQATTHRVVARAAPRLSIPFFYNPSYDARVTPVDDLPLELRQRGAQPVEQGSREGIAVDLWRSRVGAPYGVNSLAGYLRSQPAVFQRHAPELLRGAEAKL
eukprot:TRINITY_DN28905_c0_g1_i1.p1 TRINITY_DN28905_c0_g1~~TRINITY_DN28905_c0_g1_i1.p1  ORF type:complete len:356 (+),score=103.17 TRINITY_DN28905_c0_g1_i1:79-1146(+)